MSGTGQDENAGTTAVREGFRFDEAALARWMEAHVEGYAGPLTVEQFKGGQSNPTYRLVTPRRAYVLRRKPPGEVLKGAHAVDREARVLTALAKAGFPVAHVHGLCTDDSVIGSWFYVMELVEGRIFWDASFPEVPKRRARRLFRCDERGHRPAARHRLCRRSGSATMASRATISPARSAAGRGNISKTPTPGATPTWTG